VSERYDLDRLRAAFAEPDGDPPQPELCPSTEEIWAGVHGELALARLRDVVEHLASCSSCAEAWRIALLLERPETAAAAEEAGSAEDAPAGALAAAAAAAVLAVGLGVHFSGERDGPTIVAQRGGSEPRTATQWLTTKDAALPRSGARLLWRGPPGASYDLTVGLVDERGIAPPISIAAAHGLTAAEYTLPARALERLPAGADLHATLTAHLPDGRSEYLPRDFRLR